MDNNNKVDKSDTIDVSFREQVLYFFNRLF